MRILALDTSTEWCSVAVGNGREWRERESHAGALHSEHLLPMVRALLSEAEFALGDLDGIAFGAGPGSFTGIRVGCAVAQGLALGADLRVVPVSTLEALAQDARRANGWRSVLACLDARMREVYAAAYAAGDDGWQSLDDARVLKPDDVALLPGSVDLRGAGNGFAAYPTLATR